MVDTSDVQNILLVDDDEFIQDIYSTRFNEAGFDVTTAADGDEALKAITENDFDAILLDIIMPGTDGEELLEIMHDRDLISENCVIVLSNQGQPSDVDQAEEFDIDGYIIKANNVPSDVLTKVRDICS